VRLEAHADTVGSYFLQIVKEDVEDDSRAGIIAEEPPLE